MIINFDRLGQGGGGSGYTLPVATQETLGGVKIGTGIAIDSAGTISADVAPDLSGLFAGVEYDSSATSINFYDREGTLVGQVDATDFIIDGMIEDVYITGSTMVIEFNTEAGKQDIEIDLTDIFDPANYYTKYQVDAEITAATNPIQTQVDDMERVTATALTELHDSIIDLSGVTEDMATQEWVDDAIEAAIAAETARTETAYASKEDFDFISAKTQTNEQVLSAAVVELNDKFSGYTPTSGFTTINGSAITEGGNIVIESGGTYILPPATQSTLGGVKVGTYLIASQDGTLSVNVSPIISDYALLSNNVGGPYASQAWVEQQGYTDGSDVDADIASAMAAETARTESTYLKEHQSLDDYYTKSQVDAELSGITEDIDTLDEVVSQSLVDLEERKVSSASAKTIVALTQTAYDALAAKDPNTLYLING